MRMSVTIIYNKCSECRHARPSYYASSKLFCALRGIEKKTLRRCNKWDSAELADAKQAVGIKQQIGLALTEKCDELQKELTEARADIKRLKQVNAELLNLLQASSDLTDEYADHYEHPDNVEEIRDEIKEALEKAKGGK